MEAKSANIPNPLDEELVLWTIQDVEVWHELEQRGKYSVDSSRIMFQEEDERVPHAAYLWLCNKMRERVGKPPEGVEYPVWCWFKQQGKEHGKPDMRESGHGERGESVVRLKLRVPRNKVLLSDFDDWHFALNFWYLAANQQESDAFDNEILQAGYEFWDLADESKQSALLSDFRSRIVKSWDLMFTFVDRDPDGEWRWSWDKRSIQATIWEIDIEEVEQVEHFIAR